MSSVCAHPDIFLKQSEQRELSDLGEILQFLQEKHEHEERKSPIQLEFDCLEACN